MISDHHTECVCNHLTHFAVLMDFIDDADDRKVDIIFYYKIMSYRSEKIQRGMKSIAFIYVH